MPRQTQWGGTLPAPIRADDLRTRIDPVAVPWPQGYRLLVSERGAEVVGHDSAGVFYGRQTWKQICDQCNGHAKRAVQIDDWPDFLQRGVMLDISRDRVPRMATLFELIDRLASVKVNQFQLYTEHTFAYLGHETVWSAVSPMTPDQVRELDRYCAERFIELVPNQNCFGHLERWFKHPLYEPLAEAAEFRDGEAPGWFIGRPTSTLNAADPRSLDLVEDLLDQLLPCFSSDKINIGCDETFEVGCGRGRAHAEQVGRGRMYFEFLRKIIQACHRRGKTVQFWGDMILEHPALVSELKGSLDGEVIGLNWGYQPEHPYEAETAVFAEAGMPFMVCPSTHTFVSLTGRAESSLLNIQRSTEHGLARGATGMLNTIWGDFGHWQPAASDDPGLIAGAAIAWCRQTNIDLEIAEALSTHWYHDPTGKLGRGVVELGLFEQDVEENLVWPFIVPDCPIEDGALVRPWGRTGKWTLSMLERGRDRIERGLGLINASTPGDETTRQWMAELDVTARLLRHAADNVAARIQEVAPHSADLSTATKRRLGDDLAPLLTAFSANWLRRSRPGGLADSIGRLRAVQGYYRG